MKFRLTRKNYPLIIISVLGIILIAYTTSRAFLLSLTHDESFTYLWYVHESFMQIISMHIPKANNHILNSLAIKLLTWIFPANEFVVRLPNIIAHIAYIVFSILILKKSRNPILIIGGFILLNFNPYMLEFFSLARGYGISLALLIGSAYFFLQFIEKEKQQFIYFSFILGALSAISNLIYIHFYLALLITYNIININNILSFRSFKERLSSFFSINIPSIIVTTTLTLILFEPIRKLSKYNELYGHGNISFYQDTVITFINSSKYTQDYGSFTVEKISYLLFGLILILIIAAFFDLFKKRFVIRDSILSVFLCFLLLPVLSIIMQHYILGSEYPSIRLTLFFVPLLGFSIIAFYMHYKNLIFKYFSLFIISLLSLLFAFHTLNSIQFKYASEWKYDADTKEMTTILKKEVLNNYSGKQVKLGINWVFEPTINFYRITKDYNWLQQVTRNGLAGDYDYYYILKENLPEIKNVEIIKEFKTSNTLLLKKVDK